jgi:hypothetical protein
MGRNLSVRWAVVGQERTYTSVCFNMAVGLAAHFRNVVSSGAEATVRFE